MGSTAEEAFSNIRTLKAYATESAELKKYEKSNEECYVLGVRIAKWTASF
jgi:ABC-type multidrug transport system fused ATPase/permease subunit